MSEISCTGASCHWQLRCMRLPAYYEAGCIMGCIIGVDASGGADMPPASLLARVVTHLQYTCMSKAQSATSIHAAAAVLSTRLLRLPLRVWF